MADLIRRSDVIGLLEDMLLFGEYDIIASAFSKADEEKAYQAIREIPAVNRWIPCSERLPEIFKHVLIVYLSYKGEKNITIAYMEDEENAFDWCSDWNGDVIDAKVTHWMPLPELPEPPKE